jgi:hypothetical protein
MRKIRVIAVTAVAALAVGLIGSVSQAKPFDGGTGTTPCSDGTVTWSPKALWPPNHKLRDVTISFNDTTEGDTLTLNVNSVTNSEDPQSGSGAQHQPDVVGVPASDTGTATGDPATVTIQLRSERDGRNKDGRTYTINVTCETTSGGPGTATLTVTVPHDRGKHHSS